MIGTLFDLTFPLVLPFWLLMILAPGWRWTGRVLRSPFVVVPALLMYLVLIAPHLGEWWTAMRQPSLPGVRALLATEAGTAVVWAQVLAWDLFVGRWMYLDSRERRVHPLPMAPILVLTILLSPFGLLLYFGVRQVAQRSRP